MSSCGFVAVIGASNAGKSTLVNVMVGAKVVIVTPKVQTTRMNVRGVAIRGEAQIVLVDTPGIFQPRRTLDRAMVDAAWEGAGDADAVLVVVDAEDVALRPHGPAATGTEKIVESLKAVGRKCALALNKCDALARTELLPLIAHFSEAGIFEEIFPVSALKSDGLDALFDWCAQKMPAGPWLYPADQTADISSRVLAAEITREKVYLRLHDELPYATAVETEKWEERKDGSVKIDQVIFVRREGQKKILLGKGGATVKAIGEAARREMEAAFGRKVHLFLFVKVNEKWDESRAHYREIGLKYPDGKSSQ
jgi:GTPase